MRITRGLEYQMGSKEEKLPYTTSGFPYIASCAELDDYLEPFVPWHWHNAIELFYIESGELKYYTPTRTIHFSAGSAGMVNSNVLHRTEIQTHHEKNVQLFHLFEPILLAGTHDSVIEQKYITPVITSSMEIIALSPEKPEQAAVIDLIRNAFLLSEDELGYEMNVRDALSQIWLHIFKMHPAMFQEKGPSGHWMADKMKIMMIYIHEHYPEKISIPELAQAAFLSERECYRTFQYYLHLTPIEYIRSYRIQVARQMLVESQVPITEIAYACGFGNASYFGKVFREYLGMTPHQYRHRWQNRSKK